MRLFLREQVKEPHISGREDDISAAQRQAGPAPGRFAPLLAMAILLVQEVAFIELPRMLASGGAGFDEASEAVATDSNPFNLQCLLATSLAALVLTMFNWRRIRACWRANLPLLVMVAAALASTL